MTLLDALAPEPLPQAARAPQRDGFNLYTEANGVSTAEVLDRLGIAHAQSARGEMATCPGCGEDGALVCKGGGIKCLHDRCSHAGPAQNPGFRTNVDLVAHVEHASPVDAAKRICGWFGIAVPKLPDRNGVRVLDDDSGEPPAHLYDEEPENLNYAPKRTMIEIIDSDALFAELEPPAYLFAPVIVHGSVVELIAYGSSGKSWIAFDAALSAAAGVPWLGRFPCSQGPALYIDYENGAYESRRRIQAIARARELVTPVLGLGLVAMPSLYMHEPAFEQRMERLVEGRVLCVIDTLRAATPGVDENDSRMRSGLDSLHRIGERTGCAFVVLAHAKKTSGSITAIDAREVGRGSSAIFDAADTVLHVTYEEAKPLTVSQTKARSGRAVEPFDVTIQDTAGGGVLVVAQDAPEAQADGGATPRFVALCDRVLAVVREHPGCSGRVIRQHVSGARPESVLAALEVLERNGAVRNAGARTAAKWFPMGAGGVP